MLPTHSFRDAHPSAVERVQWSRNGERFFTLGVGDPRVRAWSITTLERETIGEISTSGRRALGMDARTMVVNDEASLTLYDVASASILRTEAVRTTWHAYAFSDDESWFFSGGSWDRPAVLWNLHGNERRRSWKQSAKSVQLLSSQRCCFLFDEREWVQLHFDATKRMRRGRYPERLSCLDAHVLRDGQHAVGKFFDSAGRGFVLRWHLDSGAVDWSCPSEAIHMLVPSSEAFVLELSATGALVLREIERGVQLASAKATKGFFSNASLSPSGAWLAKGTDDGSVELFDLHALLERGATS